MNADVFGFLLAALCVLLWAAVSYLPVSSQSLAYLAILVLWSYGLFALTADSECQRDMVQEHHILVPVWLLSLAITLGVFCWAGIPAVGFVLNCILGVAAMGVQFIVFFLFLRGWALIREKLNLQKEEEA